MIRAAALILTFAIVSPAWVESVEFPWSTFPKPLWERELVWLKNIGITHVSLPPAKDPEQMNDLLQIVRRLNLEADVEGPVPERLEALTKAHGGPLTNPLPGPPIRLSVLTPTAMTRAKELLASGTGALIWTDVEDTLGPSGYKAGAINFAGDERPAAIALRRSAQLSMYWNKTFPSLHNVPGVGIVIPANPPVSRKSAAGPAVRQFASESGVSVVSVTNRSATGWTGDLRVMYSPDKHLINVPSVSIPAHDALWLPVNVPLTAGPLCKDCSAFANTDHLVYATAELTAIEYENGILAMEFSAPAAGEVILQLSREPSGPLVAGGRPTPFDWDEHTQRARLKIPQGKGPGNHVRIGLAIEPPDATAFFDSAKVLMIGETNPLTAQFSSEAIEQRSRLRISPVLTAEQAPGKDPLALIYQIKVPETAVHGDHADLAIEADGIQMSHARPQLLHPVALQFPDAVEVHLSANSALPLFPATVSVNQRTGRDLMVTLRNNAPEIRTFVLEPKADGIDFSPAKLEVTVGVSTSRDVSFRVFAKEASPGLHAGTIAVSGAATAMEPIQFAVIPQTGAVAFSTAGFSFIESTKARASFIPGRWLEFLNKDTNQNMLANTGVAFTAGPIEARGDALVFSDKTVKLEDLESLALKPKR
ncbi:MAG TPA: hypothetical protein VHY84_04360 [Bryobacteraceae bacterium]|jgi:hypothetical protein|nr:hypothetical protein [Bryobacteraceae bacterium]